MSKLVASLTVLLPWFISSEGFAPPICFRARCAQIGGLNLSTKDESTEETEAERLLRMARELRAQAEAEENEIHTSLIDKKQAKDKETDQLIEQIFFNPSRSLLDQLREKRYSMDMLTRLVDRIHEREIKAKGLEHVQPSTHHTHTKFERTADQVDQAELDRIGSLIDDLIEACKVLDKEWLAEKKKRGEKYIAHTEAEHWCMGDCAKTLHDKVREMRREHEEQFQNRLQSFYDAQRKKDLPPPPPRKNTTLKP